MKKSGSVINILTLCILIVNFLASVLLHILQKEKIGPKITAKIVRVAAALRQRNYLISLLQFLMIMHISITNNV